MPSMAAVWLALAVAVTTFSVAGSRSDDFEFAISRGAALGRTAAEIGPPAEDEPEAEFDAQRWLALVLMQDFDVRADAEDEVPCDLEHRRHECVARKADERGYGPLDEGALERQRESRPDGPSVAAANVVSNAQAA